MTLLSVLIEIIISNVSLFEHVGPTSDFSSQEKNQVANDKRLALSTVFN